MDLHGGHSTFFVSPRAGELNPGETISLRVTFSPKGSHDYRVELPVFLLDQADK